MIVTWGQCRGDHGDEKWRVRVGDAFVPGAVYDTEEEAAAMARIRAGGTRRCLRTVYTVDVRGVKQAPGVPAEPKAAEEAPTDPLGGPISRLEDLLDSGALDPDLDEWLAAEHAGANRKGAIAAIEARQAEIDLRESEREPSMEDQVREHFAADLADADTKE